jgi:hypothetical protein
MANETVSPPDAANGTKRKWRVYQPSAGLHPVPGVKQTAGEYWCDDFTGTKEDLAAMGLVPSHMFPGEPGMPVTSVSLRPVATGVGAAITTPGYVTIKRRPGGKFCVTITVSKAEQLRREQCRQASKERVPTANRASAGVFSDEALRSLFHDVDAELRRRRGRRQLPTGWRVIAGGAA